MNPINIEDNLVKTSGIVIKSRNMCKMIFKTKTSESSAKYLISLNCKEFF